MASVCPFRAGNVVDGQIYGSPAVVFDGGGCTTGGLRRFDDHVLVAAAFAARMNFGIDGGRVICLLWEGVESVVFMFRRVGRASVDAIVLDCYYEHLTCSCWLLGVFVILFRWFRWDALADDGSWGYVASFFYYGGYFYIFCLVVVVGRQYAGVVWRYVGLNDLGASTFRLTDLSVPLS